VLGLRVEETDELYSGDSNRLVIQAANPLGLRGEYGISGRCDLLQAQGAEVLGVYGSDFYAGTPAFTVRAHGRGMAFYLAASFDDAFLADFARVLSRQLGLRRALEADLPEGVTAQVRTSRQEELVFLLNFAPEPRSVGGIPAAPADLTDVMDGRPVTPPLVLPAYGWRVLRRARRS
jgi:beta-galactosidase